MMSLYHLASRGRVQVALPTKSWEESLVTPHTTHVISCQLHALRLSGYIFTGGREESQRNGGVLRVMEWHVVLHNAGWGKPLWMASTCKQHILVLWVLADLEGVRNQPTGSTRCADVYLDTSSAFSVRCACQNGEHINLNQSTWTRWPESQERLRRLESDTSVGMSKEVDQTEIKCWGKRLRPTSRRRLHRIRKGTGFLRLSYVDFCVL